MFFEVYGMLTVRLYRSDAAGHISLYFLCVASLYPGTALRYTEAFYQLFHIVIYWNPGSVALSAENITDADQQLCTG